MPRGRGRGMRRGAHGNFSDTSKVAKQVDKRPGLGKY